MGEEEGRVEARREGRVEAGSAEADRFEAATAKRFEEGGLAEKVAARVKARLEEVEGVEENEEIRVEARVGARAEDDEEGRLRASLARVTTTARSDGTLCRVPDWERVNRIVPESNDDDTRADWAF